MNGVMECATAIADPSGLKETPNPSLAGNVAGFVYFVPKPDPDQGYAVMNGFEPNDTAIAEPSGLKATLVPLPVGNVAGSAYFVPKPDPDHG